MSKGARTVADLERARIEHRDMREIRREMVQVRELLRSCSPIVMPSLLATTKGRTVLSRVQIFVARLLAGMRG